MKRLYWKAVYRVSDLVRRKYNRLVVFRVRAVSDWLDWKVVIPAYSKWKDAEGKRQ